MARRSRGILSSMLDLDTEVQRILRDMFPEPRTALASAQKWSPPTDVFRTPEGIVVRMELAGVDQDEIDITFKNNALIVRGVRSDNFEEPKEAFWQLEIAHGPFERIIRLPAEVDGEKIEKAQYEQGLLIIKLPIVKGETTKLVKVRTGTEHDA